ncbi:MAG TPA: prephenate dehydratase [Actinospica sp.]|nr:prephenate dehydratase [Actinospica sp.]
MSQRPRYAFLGPAGTFTEAALLSLPGAASIEGVPCASVPAAFDAVRSGGCEAAVAAMESSVEGAVTATMDELAVGEPLMIVREMLLPITFALLVRPGTDLAAVKTVASHPVAEPQCRRWLGARLPEVRWEAAASNAEAARQVRDGVHDAALAGAFTAARYGLEVLADGIHDNEGAQTRFVVVTRPGRPSAPTGLDKTSLTVGLRDNHPGELMEILEEFAGRGVNLCRIESRPTGEAMGKYYFFIDCEGHIEDERVGEALLGLRRNSARLRFLGSYPRADGQPPAIRPGTSDAEFTAARDWLTAVRDGNR